VQADGVTNDSTIPWTLTSADPWLTLTTDPSGAGALQSLSGTGSATVYLVATDNSAGTNIRKTTIYLNNVATNVVTTVVQNMNLNNAPGGPGGTLLPSTYVGAFWRADQTGERIIRIVNVPAGSDGGWTAVVSWYDPRWTPLGSDGIALSTAPTLDGGVTWAAGDSPGDAESYPVNGNAQFVSGTVAVGQAIIFRIGLQRKFSDTGMYKADNPANPADVPDYATTFPARYAVVVLSYNNGAKVQKIFLRQGEGSDYVMRPTDASTGAYVNPAGRPAAARFSPYNLTAGNMNQQVDIPGTVPAVNPGKFTQYPSQAGAYFQWARANDSYLRYAWDAYLPGAPAGTNITLWSTYPNTYWTDASNLGATNETCPQGYRRANDGPTDNISAMTSTSPTVAADMAKSESRQSLYEVPQFYTTGTTANNVYGYYADGFFDRRRITNGPAGSTPGTNSTVSVSTRDIAHIGRLFFNKYNNASLFFPSAGRRLYNDATLVEAGTYGYYWTSSSPPDNSQGWMSIVTSANAYQYSSYRSYGFPIRCVHQ